MASNSLKGNVRGTHSLWYPIAHLKRCSKSHATMHKSSSWEGRSTLALSPLPAPTALPLVRLVREVGNSKKHSHSQDINQLSSTWIVDSLSLIYDLISSHARKIDFFFFHSFLMLRQSYSSFVSKLRIYHSLYAITRSV